ncbi:hypothetical protein K710_0411 [Streptococcus iniae SF1]|nr:hypothetical protein K710_0411 [Streptococcus iniae SF1]EKB52137.1 hypothetical protein A0G_1236 [Streptococcus iniae 9117]
MIKRFRNTKFLEKPVLTYFSISFKPQKKMNRSSSSDAERGT